MQNSDFYQNHASFYGGAIGKYGTLDISTTTLDSNTAATRGGGIYDYEGGQLDIKQSTLSNNTSMTGGGVYLVARVGLSAQNSLIADNTHRYGSSLPEHDDCLGSINSLGYNLIEETANCSIGGTTTGNMTGLDPQLSPLQNNIGPTQVQVPMQGSPAIDAGQTPNCTDVNSASILIDQRGVPRIGVCDIGAFEFVARLFLPLVRR